MMKLNEQFVMSLMAEIYARFDVIVEAKAARTLVEMGQNKHINADGIIHFVKRNIICGGITRPQLYKLIAEIDGNRYMFCVGCQYNLRGQLMSLAVECPECGCEIAPWQHQMAGNLLPLKVSTGAFR